MLKIWLYIYMVDTYLRLGGQIFPPIFDASILRAFVLLFQNLIILSSFSLMRREYAWFVIVTLTGSVGQTVNLIPLWRGGRCKASSPMHNLNLRSMSISWAPGQEEPWIPRQTSLFLIILFLLSTPLNFVWSPRADNLLRLWDNCGCNITFVIGIRVTFMKIVKVRGEE